MMDEIKNTSQLRPYYDADSFNAGYSAVFKPDKGVVDPHGVNMASKLNVVSQQALKKFGAKAIGGTKKLSELTTGLKSRIIGKSEAYGERVNDKIASLSNLEWHEFLNYKVWQGVCERILQEIFKQYLQHLIQLPFDTARLLLQVGEFNVHDQGDQCENAPKKKEHHHLHESEGDDVDYFPSIDVHTHDSKRWAAHAEQIEDPASHNSLIAPASLHTMDLLNSVMDKEGTKGVWRANNTAFIYNFLSESLNAWFTGLFSPLLQVPDPHFTDIIHSPDVRKSLMLALAACAATGVVLLPLDLIKTRLIVSKIGGKPERSLRRLIRNWSWRNCLSALPGELFVLNVVHSVVGKALHELTNIGLHQRCHINRYSMKVTFHVLDFLSSCMQLFFKLPVEALLRRCQLNFLLQQDSSLHINSQDLIIKPRPYQNIFITFREYKRLPELWRGWRIGLMGVVCGHGLKIIELQNTDLPEEEKF